MGYEAFHAGNGAEAMDVLAEHASDIRLILLDWNMPVQDGYETIKKIKENKNYDHICIIMISTESEDEKIDQVLGAGANGYLAKPFTEQELAEKINKTMESFKSK